MSYARLGPDSSVYVIGTDCGIVCLGCLLEYGEDCVVPLTEPGAMIAHLERHLAAGHAVPDYALERLRAERNA